MRFKWLALLGMVVANGFATEFEFDKDFKVPLYDCEVGTNDKESKSDNTKCDVAPNIMIDGKVCPISGDLSLSHLDAQVVSAAPISLDRSYSSSRKEKVFHPQGWVDGHYGGIFLTPLVLNQKHFYGACFCGPYKQKIFFYSKLHSKKPQYDFVFNEYQLELGMSNLGGHEISGRSQPKNMSLRKMDKGDIGHFELKTGAGLRYIFRESVHFLTDDSPKMKIMTDQILPSGFKYKYTYDFLNRLTNVTSYSYRGIEACSASYEYDKRNIKVKLSNGALTEYVYDKKNDLIGAYSSDAPSIEYEYNKHHELVRQIRPENRWLSFEYHPHHKQEKEPMYGTRDTFDPFPGRVTAIKAPSNRDGSSCTTHTISYKFKDFKTKDHSTNVIDACGFRRQYVVNKGRVDEIRFFHKNNKTLYSYEKLFWGDLKGLDSGNLMKRTFSNGAGNHLTLKKYTYDKQGNPIKESLYGNITNTKHRFVICNENGEIQEPRSDCQEKTKGFEASRNLLIWEEDGRTRTEYTYLEYSDQIKKRLVLSDGKIQKRHFFFYDMDRVLVKEILDDGSGKEYTDLTGITERKIKTKSYKKYLSAQPTVEEEFYLDLNTVEEKLITRHEWKYDSRGRVIFQQVYDCYGAYDFHKEWAYDGHGNIIKEWDSHGNTILRTYDANDNLLSEEGPIFDHKKVYAYDLMNRLIRIEEHHAENIFTSHNFYDGAGKKVSEVDSYGNKTDYEYDCHGNQTVTVLPLVESDNGDLVRPRISKAFDELGFIVEVKDSKSRSTQIFPNIFNKPLKITYPDGATESWEYNIFSEEVKHTLPNGSYSITTRDWQGRDTKTQIYSSEHQLLSTTSKTYSTFQLLSETNEMGETTYYEYDGAGRLSSIRKNNQIVELIYNSKGQLAQKVSAGLLFENFKYDSMGNLIEETQTSLDGAILLSKKASFDRLGRKVSELHGDKATYYYYNSKEELTEQIDPLGRSSKHEYNHKFINDKKLRVCKVTSTSPDGTVKEVIHDSAGRSKATQVKDVYGNVVQRGEAYYDISGLMVKTSCHVIYNGVSEKEFRVESVFDSRDRLIELVEGAGTVDAKKTSYACNIYGQRTDLIKPDGVRVHYQYDPLGRVVREVSTDQTIDYRYSYDPCGRLTLVEDVILNTRSERKYDTEGRMIEETLAHHHKVNWLYDSLGRSNVVQHSGQAPVYYSYDAAFMRQVQYKDQTFDYHQFDLGGKLLNGAGIEYKYDKVGRLIFWSGFNQQEDLAYDMGDNLIERKLSGNTNTYKYDALNQLQQEEGAFSNSYNHDSLYNRRLKNEDVCQLNDLNQLISVGTCSYEWDRNGNRIAEIKNGKKTDFVYDARDRLIQVHYDDQVIHYEWDFENRRLKKDQQEFLYQGQNEVGSTLHNLTQDFRVLGLGKGAEIGATLFIEIGENEYFPLHDSSGSIIALYDHDKNLAQSYTYSAFGELKERDLTGNSWQFSSKRFDAETGLTYFGRRLYEASTGRFVTADPLGYAAGPNLYAYCLNSPLTHFDLYGLESEALPPFQSTYEQKNENVLDKVTRVAEKVKQVAKDAFNKIGRGAKAAVSMVGTGAHVILYNALPHIPLVKDGVLLIPHFLQHGTFDNFLLTWKENHSQWISAGVHMIPGYRTVHPTGMGVCVAEAQARIDEHSAKLGGYRVDSFVPSHHGLISNIVNCALQKLRIPTNASHKFYAGMTEMAKGVGKDGMVNCWPHSLGNIFSRNLGERWSRTNSDLTNRVRYTGLASPVNVKKEYFRNVYIAMSSRDAVCMLAGYDRFNPPSHIHVIQSTEAYFIDHRFDNQIYSETYNLRVLKFDLERIGK